MSESKQIKVTVIPTKLVFEKVSAKQPLKKGDSVLLTSTPRSIVFNKNGTFKIVRDNTIEKQINI